MRQARQKLQAALIRNFDYLWTLKQGKVIFNEVNRLKCVCVLVFEKRKTQI